MSHHLSFQSASIKVTSLSAVLPDPSPSYEDAVKAVRFLSIDAVEQAGSGHPGAPMGLATIAVEIFAHHLTYNPADPLWANRDRFILSCGHASMLLYSVLHLSGYDVSLEDIKNFRQWDSKTPGHPEFGHTPGVETTTGPLGQGISNAVGMALSSKMAAARTEFNGAPVIDYNVFTIASDGDIMEGVAYEACSMAGHFGLDNLIVVYDANNVTIDGKAEASFTEDVGLRFRGLGWEVSEVDGHDQAAVRAALNKAKSATKPALIIAKTHIGYGAPTKQDSSSSHGSPLGALEIQKTKEAANWPLTPAFHVPPVAYRAFDEQKAKSLAKYEAWKARLASLSTDDQTKLEVVLGRPVPDDLFEQLLSAAKRKDDATRNHAGHIQQKVAELVPALVGGSADLASSVKTRINDSGDVQSGQFGHKNLNFGIREHGMGAVLNGMALSGLFIPFGSTFLIFSDYMRPPMRLAGLMKQQVIYVFSHDSIFLGEDGPTHQPVEQLWTMRMVPNLDVYRPADALECAAAWTYALKRTGGPTVLSLTRHTVPELTRPEGFRPEMMLEGGYVLCEAKDPDLILIATGSEVSEAVKVKDLLAQKGKSVGVVSMPCVEAFLRLPKERQDQILPPGVRRASFELGVTGPWKALTGLDGIEVGVDTFGASAPWERLQQEYGVTAEQVAAKILAEMA